MSDKERPTLTITPETCRAARSVLSLTIRELAFRAEVGPELVSRYENRLTRMKPVKMANVQEAFERAGISFLPPTRGAGPGLRVREPGAISSVVAAEPAVRNFVRQSPPTNH